MPLQSQQFSVANPSFKSTPSVFAAATVRTVICLLVLVCITTGCANNKDKAAKRLLTEQQYYEDAQKAMKSKNFILAIEQLQQLESRFPFGRYAEQTQLDLIYAYYRSLDYGSSAAQSDRFIRQYPNHNELDYAYYMRGLASYSIDRDFLARFLPTKPSERDITPAKEAFAYFNRFLEKFPNSEYALDAQQRMVYIKALLAEREITVAEYYMKRKAYVAAANRGRYVVEHFQGTKAVPAALAIMIEAYTNLELEDLSTQAENTLATNFPDYERLKAGKLQFQKDVAAEDRSWINIISFGLLGS